MTRDDKLTSAFIALTFAGLLTFLGVVFPERLITLHIHWTTPDDLDMGYFLLALFAYFAYQSSRGVTVAPRPLFLPLSLVIAALYFAADVFDLKTLFFVAAALSFPLLILIGAGKDLASRTLIPWGLVIMAMPFWYLASPVLQTITVKVVSMFASLLSLTTLVEGNYFTIPTGVVHVAGGCSGLKYFLTGISLALISSCMDKRTIKVSILSAILAALFAMLGNWIRVLSLLLIAYYEGIDHPLMADHDSLGWVIFFVVMACWLLIDKKIISTLAGSTSTSTSNDTKNTSESISKPLAILVGCLVIFTIPGIVLSGLDNNDAPPKHYIFAPKQINSFSAINHLQANKLWQPDFEPADEKNTIIYKSGKQAFETIILSYSVNGESELAKSSNKIFNPDLWLLISDDKWTHSSKPALKLRIAMGKMGNHHRVVYYWYRHGTKMENSILASKLSQFKASFKQINTSQLVAISKECNLTCQKDPTPSIELQSFMQSLNNSLLFDQSEDTHSKL